LTDIQTMKKALIVCTATLAIIGFTSSAEAAKPNKTDKSEKRAAGRMLGRFDANHDGSLDATEAQRVRMAFEALKNLDTDKNGELSDSEITAAKVPQRRAKGAKRNQ
jgi:hypothetical protein